MAAWLLNGAQVNMMIDELTLLSKDQALALMPRPGRDETPRERRYYVWTVGCQMNVSDSERLESALQGVGYAPADQPEDAGFIVLNSCSVRASAEERILGKLGDLQHLKRTQPDTTIVLWGCMVGPNNQ